MTNRRHRLIPFTGLLVLASILFATAAMSADRCAPHQRTVLSGKATAQGYEMTQQLTLTRTAGPGLYGRWTGVRLEAWMKYDRPVDRVGSKMVELPASQAAPELGGKGICYYGFANSNTIHYRCETGMSFDIRASGVYWAGRNVKIGTASGKTISIDMAMSDRKNPMLATTPMVGTVIIGTALDFQVAASVTKRIPAPPATEISVTITPDPTSQQALNSMTATASVSAKTIGAHVKQVVRVPEGRRVDILLLGASPNVRMGKAGGVTIQAEAKYEGCIHQSQVDLRSILENQGLKP